MSQNITLLLCELILPIIFIITGLYLWKLTPPYKGMGYHTTAAERSPEAWAAAQKFSGFRMVIFNIPLLILTAISWVLCIVFKADEDIMALATTIKTAVGVILMLVIIIMTESMLRHCFKKNSQPK